MTDNTLNFELKHNSTTIIKVIGVGGGGGNAVNHMYKEGINDVSFVLCNTDRQALVNADVPSRVLIGPTITYGLGAGNQPDKAKTAAEESAEDIRRILEDGTKMAFVTAGMGGGTGTGAAPVIAKIAKDMGILTVGIVTIPFVFEGEPKILQALNGVEAIRHSVDALLVINNERLLEIFSDITVRNAFKRADNILTVAARSIAEIITVPGHINLDFADVSRILKDGGVAVMNSGESEGEDRVKQAIESALHSPLLNNNDVFNAKKILFNIYSSEKNELKMEEMNYVNDFMAKFGRDIEVIWGTAFDNSLGDKVKITVLATGFGLSGHSDEEENNDRRAIELIQRYYGQAAAPAVDRRIINTPKPVVLTAEQMDDDALISLLEENPAYCRDAKVLQQIKNAMVIKSEEATSDQTPKEENPENIINFN